MEIKIRYIVPLLFLLFLSQPVFSDAYVVDNRTKIYGDYVEGRPMNTSFIYEIQKTHEPIDTALVIDESGSMGGVIEDAKDGAKSYVDNTLTSEGDENAVVEFESSASTIQSLTSSKSSAKDAIDTISAGGGTDLPAGVSEGHDALNNGYNDLQVMIVLADGGGGDPGTQADNARADGIEVHGIMYGSGASTSEFESMTDSDTCSTNSDENEDGDNCWYAESGTIDKVYSAIQEDISPDADGELHVRVPNYARTFEDYKSSNDLGSTNEYIYDVQVEEGVFRKNFTWYPTENGTDKLINPGTSYIEVTESGTTSRKDYEHENYSDINYTDYYIDRKSIIKKDDEINVSLRVGNNGNVETIPNEIGIYDESSNERIEDLAPLQPGETVWKNISISTTDSVVQEGEPLEAEADYGGIWDGTARSGAVGEQDESNNTVNLGFPPEVTNYRPNSIEFLDDKYSPNYTIQHPNPAQVEGKYDKLVGGDLRKDDEDLNKPKDNVLETDELEIDDVEVYYNMTANLTDNYGARTIFNHSYFVENPRPTIIDRSPSDGGVSINSPVELEITPVDPNDEELDIRFYDESDGSLIGKTLNHDNDTQLLQEWEVETLGLDYDWKVQVSDPWDDYNETNTFTKIVGASYRVQTNVETDYSTIIISQDSTRDIFFTAENRVPFERNLVTEVSGAGATIDGSTQKSYDLGDGETERFSINLNPQKVGEQTLYINTTNTDTSTKIVDRVPVVVRDYETVSPEAAEVPGINVVQLMVLFFSSIIAFYSDIF